MYYFEILICHQGNHLLCSNNNNTELLDSKPEKLTITCLKRDTRASYSEWDKRVSQLKRDRGYKRHTYRIIRSRNLDPTLSKNPSVSHEISFGWTIELLGSKPVCIPLETSLGERLQNYDIQFLDIQLFPTPPRLSRVHLTVYNFYYLLSVAI